MDDLEVLSSRGSRLTKPARRKNHFESKIQMLNKTSFPGTVPVASRSYAKKVSVRNPEDEVSRKDSLQGSFVSAAEERQLDRQNEQSSYIRKTRI